MKSDGICEMDFTNVVENYFSLFVFIFLLSLSYTKTGTIATVTGKILCKKHEKIAKKLLTLLEECDIVVITCEWAFSFCALFRFEWGKENPIKQGGNRYSHDGTT